METVTASIWVELEISVSGTYTDGCRESHNPPSPAEPAGWDDISIEGIVYDGETIFTAPTYRRDALTRNAAGMEALRLFLGNLERRFSEQIEDALSEALPDGPDPDDARDAEIDRRLMERGA